MNTLLYYLATAFVCIVFAFLAAAAIVFFAEKERRAFSRAMLLMTLVGILLAGIWIASFIWLNVAIGMIGVGLILLFFLPIRTEKNVTGLYPKLRYDERETMFSRNELVAGNERYNVYYRVHPGHKGADMQFRAKPGLLKEKTLFYHKKGFQLAQSQFDEVARLHPYVNLPCVEKKTDYLHEELTKKLKAFAISLGAKDVGITKTRPYHYYAFKGRGADYGRPVEVNHNFAIAFTVVMDGDMVAAAPKASIVVESSKQYLKSGKIAIDIAETIRDMGYEARAHIDGNYEVICPLVARDAGLGEIGRMGLLMTPQQGPRVRIAVVTTNMELTCDTYSKNHALIDFCRLCKKCADCCPGGSIPFGEPETSNGVRRWKINSETCFNYWCLAGTDCGRCMAVCPFSHPDNPFHNTIRRGIKFSGFFRILARYGDDFFCGKKPKPRPLPEWLGD